MSNVITIPKINDEWSGPFPSWDLLEPHKGGTPRRPVIFCNCGKMLNIGNHHIHKTGEVRASVYHSEHNKPCGWHVFVNLEGYEGPEFLPEDGKRYPL